MAIVLYFEMMRFAHRQPPKGQASDECKGHKETAQHVTSWQGQRLTRLLLPRRRCLLPRHVGNAIPIAISARPHTSLFLASTFDGGRSYDCLVIRAPGRDDL